MAKIQIKQVKSRINRPARQKRTLDALGLKKLNHTVTLEATPRCWVWLTQFVIWWKSPMLINS